jgi:hypothetical protein
VPSIQILSAFSIRLPDHLLAASRSTIVWPPIATVRMRLLSPPGWMHCVVAETGGIEPVSAYEIPVIRENIREFPFLGFSRTPSPAKSDGGAGTYCRNSLCDRTGNLASSNRELLNRNRDSTWSAQANIRCIRLPGRKFSRRSCLLEAANRSCSRDPEHEALGGQGGR